ncbi:hypothetical protein VC0395_1110 [Vibrio cholerae O395]|uniref:Uncharacterized protein n=1 Tax=Vibrio cholerae serotype O1 (strain ATCC 39541 / Classical Ogawa 395 / O395) TaxID=345073 RepID=A0A0H3AFZ0_VIBC3|nr:hypothetical protein VC0395_1110 [Vibrio cholerae O395]
MSMLIGMRLMGMSSLNSNTRVFGIRAHSSKAKNEWKSIY